MAQLEQVLGARTIQINDALTKMDQKKEAFREYVGTLDATDPKRAQAELELAAAGVGERMELLHELVKISSVVPKPPPLDEVRNLVNQADLREEVLRLLEENTERIRGKASCLPQKCSKCVACPTDCVGLCKTCVHCPPNGVVHL